MSIKGNTDSIVVRFHSWIFIQSKESADANSELFKEDDDEAMYKIHMKFDSAIGSAFPKVHIGKETLIAAQDDGVRVSLGGARNE